MEPFVSARMSAKDMYSITPSEKLSIPIIRCESCSRFPKFTTITPPVTRALSCMLWGDRRPSPAAKEETSVIPTAKALCSKLKSIVGSRNHNTLMTQSRTGAIDAMGTDAKN